MLTADNKLVRRPEGIRKEQRQNLLTNRPSEEDEGGNAMGRLLREEDGFRFRLPESDLRRSAIYKVCAWCRKVKVGNDWFELEEEMRKLEVFATSLSPKLTHGLCSSCLVEVQKELEECRAEHNDTKIHHQPHHRFERTP
jgi:hypothetical protein